jgi:sterol desaturase/sphingolipid hydroxylase (fatty acid hydroxylase superfamily)
MGVMGTFYAVVAATLAFDALLLGGLAWAYQSPRFASRRLSDKPSLKVSKKKRLMTMAFISTLSLAAVIGPTYFLFDALVATGPAAWWVIALQTLGILVVYDFTYYWLHRTLHHKKLMRWVHGVHHRVRNPSALESFYLHPVELLAGLGLLFAATLLVGPVHPVAFLIAFFVYSTLNITIHSGLDLRSLGPLNVLTKKHQVHHQNDMSKNYASLTPIPDMVFGTLG